MERAEIFEIAKIGLSSFLGFALALLLARLADHRQRRREQLASGNLALFTLKNQFNDFLLFRREFRSAAARRQDSGRAPLWALMAPSMLELSDARIDFKSLSFLFERRDSADLFAELQETEIAARDLIALHRTRNDLLDELHQLMVQVLKRTPNSSSEEMAKEVGPALIARVESTAIALARRADNFESVYLSGYNSLRAALVDNRNGWLDRLLRAIGQSDSDTVFLRMNEPRAGFALAELPAWPEVVVKVISSSRHATQD